MKTLRPLLILFAFLLLAPARAQEAPHAMSAADYKALKGLMIKNMEKDTYVKFDAGYVLDRYEMKPPFVFKFSDGVERKIYLYRVYETGQMQELGLLAKYVTSKSDQVWNLPIPSAPSGKEAWGLYIDDIKDYDKATSGFAACLAFALSKETMQMLGGGTGETQASSDEEYEYCFPADAPVRLADGTELPIALLRPGMMVATYGDQGQLSATRLMAVRRHATRPSVLWQLEAGLTETLTAGLRAPVAATLTLTATGNHPLLTPTGRRALADLRHGDVVYGFDSGLNGFQEMVVRSLTPLPTPADVVYTLETEHGNYLVSQTVVTDK